jgi:hypothetical protein
VYGIDIYNASTVVYDFSSAKPSVHFVYFFYLHQPPLFKETKKEKKESPVIENKHILYSLYLQSKKIVPKFFFYTKRKRSTV